MPDGEKTIAPTIFARFRPLRATEVSSYDCAAKRCRRRVRLRRAVWRKCSCAVPFFWTHWIDVVTRNKRIDRSATEPKAWWQRVLAGEPVPKDLFRQRSKCGGTVEDHRNIALDVRELIRHRVFDQPVGSIFHLNIRFPWLRMMRLNSCSFDLELVTGRTVIVPLVWARCGIVGERVRIECPLCARRVCALYFLDGRIACRHCNGLWYGAQRTSAKGRKFRAMKNVRRKLGDYGQLWAAKVPPKPRGMWRRTYARHCAALARIERKLFV
jgi:hypothetical protein